MQKYDMNALTLKTSEILILPSIPIFGPNHRFVLGIWPETITVVPIAGIYLSDEKLSYTIREVRNFRIMSKQAKDLLV